MKILKKTICVALSSVGLMAAACGDDGDKAVDASVDTVATDAEGCVCDPVGSSAPQGTLLNAPLTNDVQVITRAPRHPATCDGPENLP
jgi:hypothetical protein